jgi:hypothetical protein
MNINETNIKAIHDELITDIQRMIFRQHNELKVRFNVTDEDYDVTQTLLVDKILHTTNIRDINELLVSYSDVVDVYGDNHNFTLDGTLNYVLGLLVKRIENDKQIIHNWNLGKFD